MKPEEKARLEIDKQLEACGWDVQDHANIHISANTGVAVREFPLPSGSADYLLYANGLVVGAVEAKPEGHTLGGVTTQSLKYLDGVPKDIRAYPPLVPFHYETTGVETYFTNRLDPDHRSRPVFTFHRPEELLRQIALPRQLRAALREMPELETGGMWDVQAEAVRRLEDSLGRNRPRALVQMATGSGKTLMACGLVYRLIKFADAKRILFLVDRKSLGKQAYEEFSQYESPYNRRPFGDEHVLQHLTSNVIMPSAKLCFSTIQRVYSMLKGDEDFEEENEEKSMFETWAPLPTEAMPVVYNPRLPIEHFDFIIVDECHRSIYSLWKQVLDYFDAFVIGLTATPTKQTIGFFNRNLVMEYDHNKAVVDKVNVGFDVYRIRTKISDKGVALESKPDVIYGHRDRRTRSVRWAQLDEDMTVPSTQLNRAVVVHDQIRTIIRAFRDKVLPAAFPDRERIPGTNLLKNVPKTLVFALDDAHAEDITHIIREEFDQGNEFCQKITYKTTGKKPEDLLQDLRTMYYPRVAVTVDMIATGTDVKPLECLLFMRNVDSASYFEQMKGRGVRTIDPDSLQAVTPDAKAKVRFIIVDAVGVCTNKKSTTKPLDRAPKLSMEKILGMIAEGRVHPVLASTLAARLARLETLIDEEEERAIAKVSGGQTLHGLTADLATSVDPDVHATRAAEIYDLAEDDEPTDEQLHQVERQLVSEALKPFHNPKLRELLLALRAKFIQIIDPNSLDALEQAGPDHEAAQSAQTLIANFRQFIEDNKDELEVIQILYSKPHSAGLRYSHAKELAAALSRPPVAAEPERLWQAFETVEPDKVQEHGGHQVVDVVSLVRHALTPDEPLIPFATTVQHRYEQWLQEKAAEGIVFTPEQQNWLDAIRDHIAAGIYIEAQQLQTDTPFSDWGGWGKISELFGDRLAKVLDELNERLTA